MKEFKIADLDTIHFVQNKTPQAWAVDYYYFIKDNQLFQISFIHSSDRIDWPLYEKILQSFKFEN